MIPTVVLNAKKRLRGRKCLPAFKHSESIGLPPQASAKDRTLSKEDRSQANAPAAPDLEAAAFAFSSVLQAT